MTAQRSSEEILKSDFRKFVWFVWKNVLGLPPPTRVQLDIALFLESGSNRRFIQAFRGIGKSFLTCSYVVWRLWKDPQQKILIVSASEGYATDNATLIKQIIDHEAGDDLWAGLRPKPSQRSSVLSFDVGLAKAVADKQPSVKALGVGGQLTGNRADIIIADDIEVPKNSETEDQREKLMRRVEEFASIKRTGGEAEIIYLGTPQSEQSVYRHLPDKGYRVRVWPGRYPRADKLARYGDTLAPILAADIEADPSVMDIQGSPHGGKPTDPHRFTDLELCEREAEIRASTFLLQFMLDTSLSDAEKYPLKCRDLIVMDVGPKQAPVSVEWASGPEQVIRDLPNIGLDGDRFHRPIFISKDAYVPYTGSVMTIDPSGQGKDETGYCVTKFLKGMIYVRRWGGFQDGYGPATLEALAKIAKEEEVNEIEIESNFGNGMMSQLLQPIVNRLRPCRIVEQRANTRKEERILEILEPVMKQHRLVMDTNVIRTDMAFDVSEKRGLYQMTRMMDRKGALRFDDRIDALASAVAYWTEYLDADNKKALAAHENKVWRDEEKKRWAGTPVGRSLERRSPIGRGQGRRVR